MKTGISTYPFPLNLYRKLCYEMNLEPPETMTEDEAKGLEYLVNSIRHDEYMSLLIERFQYGRESGDSPQVDSVNTNHRSTKHGIGIIARTNIHSI